MFGLPLLNQLLALGNKASNKTNRMGMPAGLIISPTRELALQTAGVLNSLQTKIDVSLGVAFLVLIEFFPYTLALSYKKCS